MEKHRWHTQVTAWVVRFCTGLRLSQRKTLGEVVFGAMRCRRVSIADIGRSMATDTTAKHRIKRLWRFLTNPRIEVVEGARALACLAARAAGNRLVVAVDWVDVGQYRVLRAAVPLRGRSVPILFATYLPWQLVKSQNALEEGFFTLLRSVLPSGCEAVVLADRGFARADLARHLNATGLGYIVRVVGHVWFESDRYRGLLGDLALCPGEGLDLGLGWYREEDSVRRRVVAVWGRGESEMLILGTNMAWPLRKLVRAFKQRMMIEELFRDEKNIRYGWGLRQLALRSPERMDRLFLILALAYLMLLLFGLLCQKGVHPSYWASTSSRKRVQVSAFVVGRLMLEDLCYAISRLLRLLQTILRNNARENWG